MDENKEMELENEVEETIEDVTDEVTDLVPVNDESENSMTRSEKAAAYGGLVLMMVGAATIAAGAVKGVKKLVAKKKEKNEMAEIDQKMKNHPGFLGKFKKNKAKQTDEVDSDPEKDNEE